MDRWPFRNGRNGCPPSIKADPRTLARVAGQLFPEEATPSGTAVNLDELREMNRLRSIFYGTPSARRTVVFVDRRYYVLLDEVAPATAQPIEWRFHSYGTIAPRPQRGGWTVTQSDSALDVVPADTSLLAGTVESPSGWIRTVNLLRLASPQPMRGLTLATAIMPRTRGVATYPQVSQEDRGSELRVRVDGDQIEFRHTAAGYVISRVTKGQTLRP